MPLADSQHVTMRSVNARAWFLFSSLLATAASAGDFHTQVFDAKVRSARVVQKHAFDDRLASLDGATHPVLSGGPACELSLEVADTFFKGRQVVFASVKACDALGKKPTIRVQYLGLATAFQFVALQLGDVWRTLPLMRRTGSTDPMVLACLSGAAAQCPLHSGDVL